MLQVEKNRSPRYAHHDQLLRTIKIPNDLKQLSLPRRNYNSTRRSPKKAEQSSQAVYLEEPNIVKSEEKRQSSGVRHPANQLNLAQLPINSADFVRQDGPASNRIPSRREPPLTTL